MVRGNLARTDVDEEETSLGSYEIKLNAQLSKLLCENRPSACTPLL
jgi:hypothetical protein